MTRDTLADLQRANLLKGTRGQNLRPRGTGPVEGKPASGGAPDEGAPNASFPDYYVTWATYLDH